MWHVLCDVGNHCRGCIRMEAPRVAYVMISVLHLQRSPPVILNEEFLYSSFCFAPSLCFFYFVWTLIYDCELVLLQSLEPLASSFYFVSCTELLHDGTHLC